ncbi:hypothetical protein Back2_02840 [Nocardioides baekrokdamisoli]|uniref:ABC transporter substrate-binding protein n=1 Tax=Nocardioides baekrokdamisoli TaxID=1804624 RepID=A0A3G9IB36_9ACTN|nr:MlaD family protein [Nocardioides baekrokdamisoli]BBH15997.1 hypothetical protein Back2_02840 [Nocardioides baekrokdamisoli]
MLKKILTDKLYLSLVGVIAVFLAAVAWVYSGVLGVPLFRSTPSVTVNLAATGGLYVGSPVTFRGVKVGKITSINLSGKGVAAHFDITTGTSVPGPTAANNVVGKDGTPVQPYARVRSLSPVGEQYLDLEPLCTQPVQPGQTCPQSDYAQPLRNGDTINAAATDIPVTLGHTVEGLDQLLKQIDEKKLKALLTTAATGFGGTGDALGSSFDNMHLLLDDLAKVQPQTIDLIHNVSPTLDIINNNSGDLQALANSANDWATYLDANKSDLVTLLQQTPANLATLQGLVNSWAQILPTFFPTALQFGTLTTQHNNAIRQLLASYAPGLAAVESTVWQGRLNLLLIGSHDMRCGNYGTTRHTPKTTGTTLQPNAHCTAVPRGERAKVTN